jgi:hypothetical protein
MKRRSVKVIVGIALVGLGAVLVAAPGLVRDILGRKPATPSDWINLRSTFGGTIAGLGAFLVWWPSLRPLRRTILGLLLWSMAGIGIARAIGFAVDGSPDWRQYVWISAEVVIVAVCAVLLRHGGRRPR